MHPAYAMTSWCVGMHCVFGHRRVLGAAAEPQAAGRAHGPGLSASPWARWGGAATACTQPTIAGELLCY
jgi:hypothetical protein